MVRAGNQTILTTTNMEYLSGQTNPENGSTVTGGFYKAGEQLPDGTVAESRRCVPCAARRGRRQHRL